MKKVPCLFVRIFHGHNNFTLTEEVTSGCEWVMEGEGIATIKYDGTACLYKDGLLYKRYDRKLTKKGRRKPKDKLTIQDFKSAPDGFIPCEIKPNYETGHWPGWVPVDSKKPEDKWHMEALEREEDKLKSGRTYELVGPKIQGNPHSFVYHSFAGHTTEVMDIFCEPERSFEGLREFLRDFPYEGIVFHNKDGRMAKIRRKDFGYEWPIS